MSLDNPFRESRLINGRNYRPDWDVADLDQDVSKWMVEEVGRLRGRADPDPGQMIAVMLDPPGYGKTHLFGRIGHLIGESVLYVFVPPFEDRKTPIDHIRWHAVEALFDPGASGVAPIRSALARLCRPAFAAYFSGLAPTLRARHEAIRLRLDESHDAVLEVVARVDRLGPFLGLADSLLQLLPADAGIVRALALGWAPSPWSGTARRWLQGQDLPEGDLDALGLRDEPPSALDVLRAIGPLFGHDRPLMICLDQIESILTADRSETLNLFTTNLMEILQEVPSQLVMSCYRDQWEKLLKNSFNAFKMRVRQPAFQLGDMNADQATRLVAARIASWPGAGADRPPTWPFEAASIAQWVRDSIPTPRALIQRCGDRFENWAEGGGGASIQLSAEETIGADLAYLFLQEWNREVESIRRDSKRSAEYLPEERCYRGVFEALKIAESARRERDFGEVRIAQVTDRALKGTPASPKQAARLTLAAGLGQASPVVIVALTKIDNARKFSSYYRSLAEAMHEAASGAILIHPRRELVLGGGTRAAMEFDINRGKLRSFPLEDHPQTHQATECLVTLLDRAAHRELILGGQTLSPEDCRDLVVQTGVIDHLELFRMLGFWKRAIAPAAATAAPEVPTTVEAPAPAASSRPPSVPVPVPSAATVPPGPPPPDPAELESWAGRKLAAAVKKLGILNLKVEPAGFEVGPTFARLRVNPVGKTNYKGVSNKAVDLRISLDLEAVPIIGSQAGCISIDIQRPDRATVSLARSLARPPQGLDGLPAFPVGQDVAGQSHCLNLADPSDCHVLVAGTTGSGKSEFLRATIASLAARLGPDQLRFVLIDPKRVTFNLRGRSPYLKDPVAYELDEALPLVERCMAETERRYKLLEARKLTNVSELPPELLPRIVLVIDEFANFLADKKSKGVMTGLLGRSGLGLVLLGLLLVRFLLLGLLPVGLLGQVAFERGALEVLADGVLEGDGDGQQGGLVVEPAGEGDRAGHLAAVAVAGPVGEDGGGVAGQVGDGQVVAADVQVDRLHQAGHRSHQEGPDPGGADVFDGGGELAVAEGRGPGVEPLGDVLPGQVVECGRGFGAEHQGDRLDRIIFGQLDRDQLDAHPLEDLELVPLVVGLVVALHVADPEPPDRDPGGPGEWLVDRRVVEPVRPVDRVEDQGTVFERPRDRAQFIHRP